MQFNLSLRKLINVTKNIRQALDLQKVFYKADHAVLLTKINYYDILGVANDSFKSYLADRQQYISINCSDSGLAKINRAVSQGSILRFLLSPFHI